VPSSRTSSVVTECGSEWRSFAHLKQRTWLCIRYYAGPGGDCAPTPRARNGRPSWPGGVPCATSGRPIIFSPATQNSVPGPPDPRGMEGAREASGPWADARPLLVRAEAVRGLSLDHQRHAASHAGAGADIAPPLGRVTARMSRYDAVVRRRGRGPPSVVAAAAFEQLVVMGAYGHST